MSRESHAVAFGIIFSVAVILAGLTYFYLWYLCVAPPNTKNLPSWLDRNKWCGICPPSMSPQGGSPTGIISPSPTGIRSPSPTGIRSPSPIGIRSPSPIGIRSPSPTNPTSSVQSQSIYTN